ncbi:invasion associated locus B family protein [Terrihabitans sp. B22-R8]|uniref:invasion associated locus B family protein n=1 Tax=Terrihabitans sp. B22-R8 TaxID=3425128 RepID=UPI00403CBB06
MKHLGSMTSRLVMAAAAAAFVLPASLASAQAPSLVQPQAPKPAPERPAAQPRPAAPKPAAPKPAAQAPKPAAPNLPKTTPAAAPANGGPAPEWLKVCGKDEKAKTELCTVTSYITADAGNVVGEIRVLDVKREKESRRIIEALVPPGFLIQPGVNLVIDDAKTPIPGRYRVCFPNVCLAEVQVSDENLASLRKGATLTFFAANPQGQWVGAKTSLAGFSAAYDGAALTPEVYQERRKAFETSQNQLQSALIKRAQEQRGKIDGDAAPAGQPAPAAAPAAPAGQ